MSEDQYIRLNHQGGSCPVDQHGHCVTCADEALEATVLSVDSALDLAFVAVQGATIEVEISLIDAVAPGDLVLIHGGVAIAKL